MDHAILVAAGTGIDGERLNSHGKTLVGGIPQVKRLIITAERAGIKRFTIIVEGDNSPLKEILKNEKRIKSSLIWHSLGSAIKFEPEPSLILQSNLIISPTGLSGLMICTVSRDEIAVLVDEDKDAWVKTKGDAVEDISLSGGKVVGAFVSHGSLLEKSILNSMSLKGWTEELVGRGSVKSVRFSDGYWMRLTSDKNSRQEAENLLFSNVRKSSSGWISKNINTRISIPISRLLIRTPLTPNMISVLIGIIGMLCGFFYAIERPILGAVFLELSTILDGCDGEVARIKLMESKRGQWVDTVSDQLTFLSFVVGVPIGFYRIAKSPLAITLGSINLLIFLFFLVWSFYFLARYAHSGSMVAYPKTIDRLVPVGKRTRLHKFIIKLRPMLTRAFFSPVFLLATILGGYPWVLGLSTLGTSVILIHQIDDLIKLKRSKPSANPAN
jgi:1L-myo-inositol 1-phosphate cytidylyltransferase / CDP-L-myo-inositol myo-inositolphosphotransferase